ncbi:MAG: flagellar biosynthesis protein FlhF [Leptospira sp.]|nr:flagellar biosynthesis protein FlhF [Leptospira sp.]
MDYVTVRGKDLQDCMMQMKMKYGPEAHVYEHKLLTEGGVFGTGFLANKFYEITVAIPEKASSKERMEKKLHDLRELLKKKSVKKELISSVPESVTSSTGSRRQNTSSRGNSARRTLQDIPQFSDWVNGGSEDADAIAAEEDRGLSFVEEMIAQDYNESLGQEINPMNGNNLSGISNSFTVSNSTQTNSLSPSLEKLQNKLIEEGMSSSYVKELIVEVEQHLSPIEKGRYASVTEKAVQVLEDRIRVDSDLFAGTKKGKRKVIFIIGPTGSGKTTTLAKLAAKYSLHMGKTVSLYTTDNFRIAAVEQLKRYADTMDLPFYSVKDVRKFKEALLRDGSELVLVDTAGYSHKDRETLGKMKEYYASLGENDQLENILTLPTTISYHNAREVMKSYEELGYNRVILSKIDETDYLGSFLELADSNTKEFAYFSVGQDVPFDILGAEKKLLAECVIFPEKLKGMTGEVFSKKS